MKRFLALVLLIVFVLGLTACTTNRTDNSKPSINNSTDDTHSTTPNAANSESIITMEATDENTNQYGTLQNMINTYGFPFEFWNTEGMSFYQFTFTENNAEREWSEAGNGIAPISNLSWSIVGDELYITGEWEDTFTLDIHTGIATSLTDGRKYKIRIAVWEGDFETPTWKHYSE